MLAVCSVVAFVLLCLFCCDLLIRLIVVLDCDVVFIIDCYCIAGYLSLVVCLLFGLVIVLHYLFGFIRFIVVFSFVIYWFDCCLVILWFVLSVTCLLACGCFFCCFACDACGVRVVWLFSGYYCPLIVVMLGAADLCCLLLFGCSLVVAFA